MIARTRPRPALTSAALIAPSAVSAHTPNVSLTCQQGLVVSLTQYNSGGTNTVAVSIDGSAVSGSPFSFGSSSYSNTFSVTPLTQAHTASVAVTAWDDPTGSRVWTKTFNLSIPACVQPTPTPTPIPTPTPTPGEPTPTPGEPTPTSTPTPTPPPPTGGVGGATGTPAATSRATLPATDTPGDATSTPAGESSRLILLALAGMSAAGLLLTRSVARKDDSAR